MASIQLIISPVLSGDNRLVTAKNDMPVTELRATIAAQEKVPPSNIRLVSAEGLELEDGASLEDFFITNLSTIRLVVTGAAASAAPSAPAASPVHSAAELTSAAPSATGLAPTTPHGGEAVGASHTSRITIFQMELRCGPLRPWATCLTSTCQPCVPRFILTRLALIHFYLAFSCFPHSRPLLWYELPGTCRRPYAERGGSGPLTPRHWSPL